MVVVSRICKRTLEFFCMINNTYTIKHIYTIIHINVTACSHSHLFRMRTDKSINLILVYIVNSCIKNKWLIKWQDGKGYYACNAWLWPCSQLWKRSLASTSWVHLIWFLIESCCLSYLWASVNWRTCFSSSHYV